jgi:hypothetical protein
MGSFNNNNFLEIDNINLYHGNTDCFSPVLINFPAKDSIKVIPFYNKIQKDRINLIKIELDTLFDKMNIPNFFEEFSEKLLIVTYEVVLKSSIVFLYTAGLSSDSINTIKIILKEITIKERKIIILIYNSHLPSLNLT